MTRRTVAVIAFCVFALAILASNWLLHTFGLFHIPILGWLCPWGTVAAAISWPARDILSRASGPVWGPWIGLGAVFVGAGLALAFAPSLAVASALGYLASEGTDWGIFWALGGQRRQYSLAFGVSVTVAAVVDSIVFLYVAGIPWGVAGPGLLVVKLTIVVAAFVLNTLVLRRKVAALA